MVWREVYREKVLEQDGLSGKAVKGRCENPSVLNEKRLGERGTSMILVMRIVVNERLQKRKQENNKKFFREKYLIYTY